MKAQSGGFSEEYIICGFSFIAHIQRKLYPRKGISFGIYIKRAEVKSIRTFHHRINLHRKIQPAIYLHGDTHLHIVETKFGLVQQKSQILHHIEIDRLGGPSQKFDAESIPLTGADEYAAFHKGGGIPVNTAAVWSLEEFGHRLRNINIALAFLHSFAVEALQQLFLIGIIVGDALYGLLNEQARLGRQHNGGVD